MITIRNAYIEDLPHIIGLISLVSGDLEEIYPYQFVVATNEEGILVGCGRLRDFHYFDEIASIAVDKEYRNQDIGRQIVEALIDRSENPLFLMCENHTVKFFEKFGFKRLESMPRELISKLDRHPKAQNIMGLWK